jgi:Family of unknown function (DUF6152)
MIPKGLALLAAAMIAAAPVVAHHGSAAYEEDLTTLRGTVAKFEFINPHVLVYVDVPDGKGYVEHWIAELFSNNRLSRVPGWSRNTLRPGDAVILAGHRAKNGALVMDMQGKASSLRRASGEEIALVRAE